MRTRLRHWADRLRTNLWFVPGMIVVGSIVLSHLTLALDDRYGERFASAPYLFTGGPEGASAVLTAIASSMIGVTGVIFSITVVALTLASTQFGPRLLRAFIRDRAVQVVLGVFIGTFTFSLLGLRAIDRTEDVVPEITVNTAMALALLCLALLIFFVHHVASGIQADAIIAAVSRDLHATIDTLYPERLGHEPDDREGTEEPDLSGGQALVRATRTGYVQAIEEEGIFERVVADDLVLRLDVRPGDFVAEDSVVAHVWRRAGGEPPDPDPLAARILIGDKPTAEQDVEFLLAQLVEVGVRALSPGINDPFTASRCVDRLGAALCHLSQRRFPSPVRVDEEGRVRVVARTTSWASSVEIAFDQLRQHARGNVAVTIRLLESLTRVAECLRPGSTRIAPLAREVEQIAAMARAAEFEARDLEDVERRVRRFAEVARVPTAAQP
ncbi:MAG TPA: DUF2254 domain-containing protein [Candidatus Thermoplasmatota archaeon]|nr:DUF2254 domain-containing protein [Candidatus Thermoplasmatota archaeon]